MPETPYTPFPDLDLPPRTNAQKARDRKRTGEQTTRLKSKSFALPDGIDLDEILADRRAGAPSHVVRFALDVTTTEHKTFVLPRQLVVRTAQNNADADAFLTDNGFTPVPQTVDQGLCPELESQLTIYRDDSEEDRGVEFQRDLRQELAAQTGVRAVPPVVAALQVVVKAITGPAPTRVNGDAAFEAAGKRVPTGKVVVAIIDTGIAPRKDQRRSDGWLKEVKRSPRKDRVDLLDVFPNPNPTPPPNRGNGTLDFGAGHGTFAAGIVRMIDPEAEIRVYAALDSDGLASEHRIACAMIKAVQEGAQVLSLSLGMHTVDNLPGLVFDAAIDRLDEIAREQGRPVPAIVASAGNYGDTEKVYPAAIKKRVVSVAGLTATLKGAKWSTRGDWVTCSCVAEGIVSTFVRGSEDGRFGGSDSYPQNGEGDSWAVWAGTSFAAPQIAGAISRLMREENLTAPRQAERRLLSRATPLAAFPEWGKAIILLPGT